MSEAKKKKHPFWVYLGFFLGFIAFIIIFPFLLSKFSTFKGDYVEVFYLLITPPSYAILMVIISTIAHFRLFKNRHLVKHFWVATGIYVLLYGGACAVFLGITTN